MYILYNTRCVCTYNVYNVVYVCAYIITNICTNLILNVKSQKNIPKKFSCI